MNNYSQICENVERGVCCGWRSAVPDWVSEKVNTLSVGHENWKFSFCLRICGLWVTCGVTREPVEYDPLDGDTLDSPIHVAQSISDDLIGKMAAKIKELKKDGMFDAAL